MLTTEEHVLCSVAVGEVEGRRSRSWFWHLIHTQIVFGSLLYLPSEWVFCLSLPSWVRKNSKTLKRVRNKIEKSSPQFSRCDAYFYFWCLPSCILASLAHTASQPSSTCSVTGDCTLQEPLQLAPSVLFSAHAKLPPDTASLTSLRSGGGSITILASDDFSDIPPHKHKQRKSIKRGKSKKEKRKW